MQELTLAQAQDFFENYLSGLLDKLRPDLPPLWGRMSPQHAVEHLAWTLRNSNGRAQVTVFTPEEKLPKVRQFLQTATAIRPGVKSPAMDADKLPDPENSGQALLLPSLEAAVADFRQEWAAFGEFFKNNPDATTANAVFGQLNEEGWRRFHFKHFVHHLVQFGVTTWEAHGLAPAPPPKGGSSHPPPVAKTNGFLPFFQTHLHQLKAEIEACPDEASVWLVPEGISNSAGTLCLHLCGNLLHFAGHAIGGTGYVRDRPLEFTIRDVPKADLVKKIEETLAVLAEVLPKADAAAAFPKEMFGYECTVNQALLRLLAHLAYHLGQVNYHRRLSGQPAKK